MRVILLSLMMVCLFGYHANAGTLCLTPPCGVGPRGCLGFAEIRSKFNGTETVHGKMIKKEGEGAKKASRLVYKVPGGPRGYITIEVRGNCCWKFYQRYERHFQSCIHLVLLLFLFLVIAWLETSSLSREAALRVHLLLQDL